MSKVSEHVATQIHKAAHEHHTQMAKSARTKATLFRAMHKEAGMSADTQSSQSRMADALDHEADLHDQYAAHHLAAKEACEKAARDSLNKLVPDQVRGVLPTYPDVTAVTRAGQPPMPEKPNVPPEFAHLFEISDD
jgi:hypothetical protein